MTHTTDGFTLVEIVIAVSIASLMIVALSQAIIALVGQQQAIKKFSTADSIAQTNLQKFNTASDTAAECSISDPSHTVNILAGKEEPTPEGNFENFTQSVTISWPYSCDRSPLLESTVSYGDATSPERITHATFAR